MLLRVLMLPLQALPTLLFHSLLLPPSEWGGGFLYSHKKHGWRGNRWTDPLLSVLQMLPLLNTLPSIVLSLKALSFPLLIALFHPTESSLSCLSKPLIPEFLI